ncbi:MAG: spore cortex biosynthesis protein YabQ [Methylocystaceae bacterium]
MYSLGQQISELTVSLGLGMLVALMLQVYQLALFRLKAARWFAWGCDLLFWLLAVALVFVALLLVNGGEVRAHILLALALGAVLFRIYFYRRLQKVAKWLSVPLVITLGGIYSALTWPHNLWIKRREPPDTDENDDVEK